MRERALCPCRRGAGLLVSQRSPWQAGLRRGFGGLLGEKAGEKGSRVDNGQNSPFLGLRKSNVPKTVLASGAGNQKKTQTGWLSAFCSRAIGAENER